MFRPEQGGFVQQPGSSERSGAGEVVMKVEIKRGDPYPRMARKFTGRYDWQDGEPKEVYDYGEKYFRTVTEIETTTTDEKAKMIEEFAGYSDRGEQIYKQVWIPENDQQTAGNNDGVEITYGEDVRRERYKKLIGYNSNYYEGKYDYVERCFIKVTKKVTIPKGEEQVRRGSKCMGKDRSGNWIYVSHWETVPEDERWEPVPDNNYSTSQ